MRTKLIETKLNKPQLPDQMIARVTLLQDCSAASVILVSAQAGSGKSTIISAWLEEQSKPYCWLALDDWDNDLMQFFEYLLLGIKTIDEPSYEELKLLFDAYQTIGAETFLRALINQLHSISFPYVLIFDDYHIIRNDVIHQVIRTLFEHFPTLMQLVLITREDPPLPLAKMRAAKKLAEIRISQLRFTEPEIREYFSKMHRIDLTEEQARHLLKRTEGWIAGLQMAALSIKGSDDINGFIETFSGSHYYVMDYLMEEVLDHQTPEMKEFLLGTSVLNYFSAELCDAVTMLDTGTSNAMIHRLVKTNCFIISTEPANKWFRYHHLFKDLLRQRLERHPKSELQLLHRRAASWLKANGFEMEALQHFFNADDFAGAAELLDSKWNEMDMKLQSASWLEMTKRLPAEIIERSPILTMGYGWALLDMGDIESCTEWFEKSLKLYDLIQSGAQQDEIIIHDQTQFELLPATIASAYAYIAAAMGDVEGIFKHTYYALERIPSNQYLKLSVVEILLGFAHWKNGDLQQAEEVFMQSLQPVKKSGNALVENSFSMVLAELYIHQGEFDKAKSLIDQTITKLVKENLVTIVIPSLYLGLAKIELLQSNNQQAYELLEESRIYGQRAALMDWKYKYYLLLARLYCSEGLYDTARDCINESIRNHHLNPIPEDMTIEDVVMQIENAVRDQRLPVKRENSPAFNKERANLSLPEPLTVRELEVLSLIVSGLSNQEICDKLFLALSTVKGYNQNIFGKLGVDRRTQAAAKAISIGLV